MLFHKRSALLAAFLLLILTPKYLAADACLGRFEGRYRVDIGYFSFSIPDKTADEIMMKLFRPEHLELTGFGRNGKEVLTVDASTREDAERLLGSTRWGNGRLYQEHVARFSSTRPGDSMMVVVALAVCPGTKTCRLVEGVEVRADALDEPYLTNGRIVGRGSGAVHQGIATKSGLRLGMQRYEVQELLGPDFSSAFNVTEYCAHKEYSMTLADAARRGFPPDVLKLSLNDKREILVWYRNDRVIAFSVRRVIFN